MSTFIQFILFKLLNEAFAYGLYEYTLVQLTITFHIYICSFKKTLSLRC